MNKINEFENSNVENSKSSNASPNEIKKGPVSFLSGSLTSFLFAWISLIISNKVVIYFSKQNFDYSSKIAVSIASGFKTLIVGMCFLSTFTFSFIAIGLAIVFVKSLFNGDKEKMT